MPFDPNAESTPFISVERPDKQAPDRPEAPRKNLSVGSTPRPTDDYQDQIISMRHEETSLFCAICELRVESERLIEWSKGMGENTGSPLWGLHQQNYSADLRRTNRAKADKLKSEIAVKFPGDAGRRLLDGIFAIPGRYDVTITAQAREELGL